MYFFIFQFNFYLFEFYGKSIDFLSILQIM